MVKISDRMLQVEESPTLGTSNKVQNLKAQGMDIISLTVGEPDFETPKHIRDAAVDAIQQNKVNHYVATSGILPLRQAIIAYHKKHDGVIYETNEVIVTTGAKDALYGLFQTILNPGDEVLIPAPYWVSYTEQVKLAGGVNVIIDTIPEHEFKVTVQDLEAGRTDKTVALILNSPNNPTGTIYSKEELERIGNWAVENDIIIVSDEIYYNLCYNGNDACSLASISDAIKNQTIVINGVSKSYAMTGWRIGYAMGNKAVISKMTEFASHSANPAAVSQYAALAALTGPQDVIEEMRLKFEKRLNHLYPLLETIPGFKLVKPRGAFYVFANVKEAAEMTGYKSVSDFALDLIEEAKVAVISGDGFGFPDYIRISYTLNEDTLTEAVNRIKEFITNKANA